LFGFVILPVSVASRRSFVLPFRWDKLEIPYPFTTVCLVIGKAIVFSTDWSLREAVAKTREVARALDEAEARARENVAQ
jgi:lysophospholipid acyltransferase (LPLAT)-like uncharacterized protein